MLSGILFAMVLVVVLVLIPEGGNGETIIVDQSGKGDHTKIADALNSSSDGDTIRVWEGIYLENILVYKTVNLIGNGSKFTTIDGDGEGVVVNITADWVNISGFKVIGSGSFPYAGIKVTSDNNNISNNNCSDNNWFGIHLSYSNDNYINNNSCSNNGRVGIYFDNSHNNSLSSNTCFNNNRIGTVLYWSDGNFINDNTGSNNFEYGIALEDSHNNTLTNNTYTHHDRGINLAQSKNNTVFNNTCSNNSVGIGTVRSSNNIISNNNCSNNTDHGIYLNSDSNANIINNNTNSDNDNAGIYIKESDNSVLSNNTCSDNGGTGILLWYVATTTLNKNSLINNGRDGIFLFGSGNTLTNNTCINNSWDCIYLEASDTNTIKGNRMVGDGIFITGSKIHWNTHVIDTTNTVNGKPVQYYSNVSGITVPLGAGQVILANTTNMLVENQNLSSGSVGILMGYSSYVNLSNIICSNNYYYGIYLWYSNNNTLVENICSNNNQNGIYIDYSDDNTLTNNTSTNNDDYGISLHYSNINTLANNTCSNNGETGIRISGSDNTITNNIYNNNGDHGIHLSSSGYNTITNNICSNNDKNGILLDRSDTNTITNNTCSKNNGGIYLSNSDYNTIINNTYSNNVAAGIFFHLSYNNNITTNTISNNGIHGIRLRGTDNTLTNNICSNNDYGIFLWDGPNILTNNTISENTVGIYVEGSSYGNIVHYNNIFNNGDFGINASSTINSTYNWWGDISGPYHPDDNPDGKGDNVTDDVEFDPWLEEKLTIPPSATIDNIYPSLPNAGDEVTFSGSGMDFDGTVIAYEWKSDLDGHLSDQDSFSTMTLSVREHTISFRVKDNDNKWSDWVSTTLLVRASPTATIDDISPSPALYGELVSFLGSGFDTDGSIVAYEWKSDLDGALSTSVSFTDHPSVGNHTISFRVQDDDFQWSAWVTQSLNILQPGAELPVATITSISPNPAKQGVAVTFSGTGSHSAWSITQYAWLSNKQGLLSQEAAFSTDELWVGTHTITFKVIDETGEVSQLQNQTLVIQPAGTDDDDDDDSPLGNPVVLIIILVVIVGAVAGGVMVMKRGGSITPGGAAPAPPSQTQYSRPAQPSTPEPKPPEQQQPQPPAQEMVTIQCPGCQGRMQIPKLGKLQQIKCESCGTEGELEV